MTERRRPGPDDDVAPSVRLVATGGRGRGRPWGTLPTASGPGAGDRLGGPRRLDIRPARPSDMPACARVWETAVADYERDLGLPVLPIDLGPTERLIGHIRDTDPDRFWIAARVTDDPTTNGGASGSGATVAGLSAGRSAPVEPDAVNPHPHPEVAAGGDEEIVAFASATVRGDVWFLSMLFVLPEEQASGLGRSLLEHTFPGGRLPARGEPWTGGSGLPSILATATDAAQPISNALYARYGIVPRLPTWRMTGRPRPDAQIPGLPEGLRPVAFDEMAAGPADGPRHRALVDDVAAIDRAVLGYDRPADHRYLRREGRVGYLYRGPDDAPVAYGYASAVGRVGPIASLDPVLLPSIAGHLLRVVEPRGASTLWVPAAATGLFRALLEAGFRLEGFPALVCWDRPFAAFDRYVPISLALL